MTYYSALHYAAKAEKSASEAALHNLKNKITNCITEIPQDIKLELKDGVLTLKAGSKVYVPNGFEADGVTPKFDVVTIESDVNFAGEIYGELKLLNFNTSTGKIGTMPPAYSYSGATAPTSFSSGYAQWYDTANNKIKVTSNSGTSWTEGYGLPLGLAKMGTGTASVTSIDQIFNGFGYIGSTVFALPGVKGLIPQGRNEDGSLRNIEFVTDKVLLQQTSYNTDGASLGLSQNTVNYVTINDVVYDEKDNKNKLVSTGGQWRGCLAGFVSVSDMKFTSVQPKLPFHAVDRNDSSWIAQQGMPSKKQVNLTLGATGSTYTAPANGYFYANQQSTAAGQYISFTAFGATRAYSSSSTQSLQIFLPVPKGETLTVDYTAPTNRTFKFYYAKGEN